MYKEIAFAWADKLDSDEYKQDKGRLRTNNGFCVMGVLTDMFRLSKENKSGLSWRKAGPEGWEFAGKCNMITYEVKRWAGLDSFQGEVTVKGTITTLTTLEALNDSGKTFPEIAKIIRENWDQL